MQEEINSLLARYAALEMEKARMEAGYALRDADNKRVRRG
jgi:hypothetical protein